MKILDDGGLTHLINRLKAWFDLKVDKEAGKGLSTNDYTTAEKNKLSGIVENVTVDSLEGLPEALDEKQDKLTFDDAPTADSDNPVRSGGIYNALQSITYEIATEEEAISGTNNTTLMTPLRVDQAFNEKFKVIDGVLNVLENGEWVKYVPK